MPEQTSIFEVVNRLARAHGALNLGQGSPEEGWPPDVVDVAVQAMRDGPHQYPAMMGTEQLRTAAARHDRLFYGIDVDPQTSILVTAGATEGIASSILALVQPGDEVVLFEPVYDAYRPMVERAGGIVRAVRLEAPDWQVPWAALEAQLNAKTRMVVLNTPHNPTGKVFSRAETERLAAILRPHSCLVLCDEVYEHMVFEGHEHVPLMTLAGMHDRCIRLTSAGKTFSVTGWKVGYITAAPELIQRIARIHQFLVFTVPPNLQAAVAYGLNKDRASFAELPAFLQRKRDLFVRGLQDLGMRVTPCMGTYFVNLILNSVGFAGPDTDFCRHMIEAAKVAAIPLSAFYVSNPDTGFVRFCIAKRDAALQDALARMAQLRQQ